MVTKQKDRKERIKRIILELIMVILGFAIGLILPLAILFFIGFLRW